MSFTCKRCGSTKYQKNGKVRDRQRYQCKNCGYNFTVGDLRKRQENESLKVLCILLYRLCNCTYKKLGEICDLAPTTIYDWVKNSQEFPSDIDIDIDRTLREVEIGEIWRILVLDSEDRSSRHWIVGPVAVSSELSATLILQKSPKSNSQS
jgi:transposase-like protein